MLTFRPVRLLGIGIAVLVSGHLFGIWADVALGWDRTAGVLRHFDMNNEANVAAWFESFILLCCTAVAWLIAVASSLQQGAQTRRWWVVSALLLVMTIDEASQLHDMTTGPMRRLIGVEIGDGSALFFAWIIPIGLLALAAVGYLLPLLWSLPRGEQLRLIIAGLVYFGGSIGIEAASGVVVKDGRDSTPYHLVTTLEETFELLGALLVVSTLLAILARVAPQLTLHVREHGVGVTAGERTAPDHETFR